MLFRFILVNLFAIGAAENKDMILIPKGDFVFGEAVGGYGEGEACEWIEPNRPVYLNSFYIDKFLVTNEQYLDFAKKSGKALPKFAKDSRLNSSNSPIVAVNYMDAEGYCKSIGKRLPTEFEWEKTARGPKGYRYPWGNEVPDAGGKFRANYAAGEMLDGDGYKFLAPVDSFSNGKSPYGVFGMSGNVWQWTSTWYRCDLSRTLVDANQRKNPQGPLVSSNKTLRGGSWINGTWTIRSTFRMSYAPETEEAIIGFRCAKDATESL